MGAANKEFPLLAAEGLYVAKTAGNGNCLFNALSDQLYGSESSHREIRARVIEYMREHADQYKPYIDINPGGGARRNPKRKNAGAFNTPVNNTAPTAEEIDRVFERHLQQMAKGGTYGDNMEIVAFAAAYGVDVRVHQKDFAMMIPGSGEAGESQLAQIALHTWEHYSSIRNINGPPPGVPAITYTPPNMKKEIKGNTAKTSCVEPWMIKVAMKSLPYLADPVTVQKTLEFCNGNVDDAVSKLLDAEDRSSSPSTRGSSSVERDHDSDDDDFSGPNKKQDRRLSRATQTIKQKEVKLKPEPIIPSKEVEDAPSTNGRRRSFQKSRIIDFDDSDDEDSLDDAAYKGSNSASTSASDYSATASKPRSGGVRLKLSQPKRVHEKVLPSVEKPRSTGTVRQSPPSESEKPRYTGTARPSPPSAKLRYASMIKLLPPATKARCNGTAEKPRYADTARPSPPSDTPRYSGTARSADAASGKSQQRQVGPKQKRLTNGEKNDLDKSAPKVTSKERKYATVGKTTRGFNGVMLIPIKKGKEHSPDYGAGIKTLYI